MPKVLLKKETGHTGVLCEGARLGPELPPSEWPMPLPVIPRVEPGGGLRGLEAQVEGRGARAP